MGDEGEEKPKEPTKEPKNTRITQQTLPACKPVLDRTWVVFIFMAIALVCIPVGVVCLVYGLIPVEESVRYDQICTPAALTDNDMRQEYLWRNAGNDAALTCMVQLNITKDMNGPVYVYYEIDGMYQNHRRYVRSRSDVQLAHAKGSQGTNLCDPLEYYKSNQSAPIDPCGLIAWSYFNDTYSLVLRRGAQAPLTLAVADKGIAFKTDVKHRFGDQTPTNFNPELNEWRGGGQIRGTPNQDERFINWMRISALSRFRKLWGKMDINLKEGDIITIAVTNRYNTYSFDGKKSLVLGNTTWLGGHNGFLGIAYIVCGGVSFILGLLYLILTLIKPRQFADISKLGMKS